MVNGGGDDYSPRNTAGMHVLLKMDESTYAEDDGSDGVDDDHPISWCQRFDGGRSWYTGLGHTQASFSRGRHPLAHRWPASRSRRACPASAACGVAADQPRPDGDRARATRPATSTSATRWPSRRPATDADGDTLTYAWDFGDGGTVDHRRTRRTPTPRPGTYTAKVTVSDGKGGTASATLTVVVDAADEVSTAGHRRRQRARRAGAEHRRQRRTSGRSSRASPATTPPSLAATVTSTASAAALTVRDPGATATGHLVNGTARAAVSRCRSGRRTRPTRTRRSRRSARPARALNLLAFPAPISAHR